jgi:nucleoid-associated protein YgaU
MSLFQGTVLPGALEKLRILAESVTPGDFATAPPIVALFNPQTLRYGKEATWKIGPVTGQTTLAGYHQVSFLSTQPRTLTIELFFDTYEGDPTVPIPTGAAAMRLAAALASGAVPATGVSVRPFTARVADLAEVLSELHHPPRCQLWWGRNLLLQGVLTSLSEEFTMFLADGTPVRATLTCTFTEAVDPDAAEAMEELHSADIVRRWVVRRGDTLSAIAAVVYGDPTSWRPIALANSITDPRDLGALVGRSLTIPRLVD